MSEIRVTILTHGFVLADDYRTVTFALGRNQTEVAITSICQSVDGGVSMMNYHGNYQMMPPRKNSTSAFRIKWKAGFLDFVCERIANMNTGWSLRERNHAIALGLK